MTSQRAEAIAHGAATVINAMATGQGAAFGVDLWTKAGVKLTSEPGIIKGEIASDPAECTLLMEKTVTRVLKRFKAAKDFGAEIKTQSNIPIARGLKSSSVAANAVALATLGALGKTLDDFEVVNLGVDASFDAKVTVTGAFDDACASYFGGLVVTDNTNRSLVMRTSLPEGYSVLFHVPDKKAYTANSDVNRIRTVAPMIKVAYHEATQTNVWTALSLNGLLYSAALGFDSTVALDALGAGAVAAGLCGKGPAVTAVVAEEKFDEVKAALERHPGRIVPAQFNLEKASVVT